MVSLQLISATSAYPLLPTAISGCQHLRYAATGTLLVHAPGLQLDNEVSQSTEQPHGTVCHHALQAYAVKLYGKSREQY